MQSCPILRGQGSFVNKILVQRFSIANVIALQEAEYSWLTPLYYRMFSLTVIYHWW